jgi:hypothetical protein
MTCGISTSGMMRGCLTVYGAIYPATSITVTTFGGITSWAGNPLGGKPAITRLNEYTHLALPAVLERLESYACYEIGRKTIPATGSIRLFGRDAYLGTMAGREVTFFESLEGLEARFNGECAVLKDYRTFKQMVMHYRQRELPPAFYFEPYKAVIGP